MNKYTKDIIIDETIYPKEAVYGAAYIFIDKMYIFLDQAGKNKIKISFKLKESASQDRLLKLEGEFMNELLNYTLRLNLAKNNKKLREIIIGQAFFSAVDQKELADKKGKRNKFEYLDDPLGIAIPWEEKYGNKSKISAKGGSASGGKNQKSKFIK